jgi:ribose/xylose/arabinose/galactoside ABC-type transport system permease subunit/ABC-type branched-subunit amino acid transport system ATPase component
MRSRVQDSLGVIAPGLGVRRYGLLLLSAAIALGVELQYGNFVTVANGLTTLNNVSSLAIAAIGAAALLIAGRIDLSIGGQFALLSVVAALAGKHVGPGMAGTLACAAVALGGGLALGLFNAVLVRVLNISPLIVTIATGGIYLGAGLAATGGFPVDGIPEGIAVLGTERVLGIPIALLIAAGLFAAGTFVLLGTVTGLRVYAIGGNGPGAALTGVPVERIVTQLFCVQGLLVGLVALLEIGRVGTGSATFGAGFEIEVLTAVLLGGVLFSGGAGRPLALLLGVVTIGVVNAALVFVGVADWWNQIIRGSILLIALGADQLATHRREREVLRTAQPGGREDAEVADGHVGAPYAPAAPAAVPSIAAGEQRPMLRARGIELRYGAVQALRGVDFDVVPGEVTCLVGDNGAGKSSLVKVLSGAVPPSSGSLELDGHDIAFDSPLDARRHGIETVYQDLAVCTNLNIAHNVVLGAEPTRGRLLRRRDDRQALEEARRRLRLVGTTVTDYRRPVQRLSGGQRQAIAIARVLHEGVKVALFDEPTAALGVAQTARVLELVKGVARQGVAVILITHDIEAVLGVADRVVVLRLGEVSFDGLATSLTEAELAQFMAGLPPERVRARARTTTST